MPANPTVQSPGATPQLRYITSAAALATALPEILRHPVCGVDTETTGLDPHTDRLRLLQLATPDAVYVIDADRVVDLRPLAPFFERPRPVKVFHNAKFDLPFLAERLAPGKPLGAVFRGLFDTMLAAMLLEESDEGYSLAALCKRFLGYDLDKTEQKSDWSGPLSAGQIEYAAKDAAILLPLRSELRQRLIDASLVRVAKLEFDLAPVVADMETAGFYLDLAAWEQVWNRYRAERERLAEKVRTTLGSHLPGGLFGPMFFNPDSPDQVLEALRNLGIDVPHTGESALKPLAERYPPVADLLEYRAVAKAVASCGDLFPRYVHPKTGRIHARYRQIGARSGRMSCREPNVQQVPRKKEIRACFRAPAGRRLIVADYSQVELRVAAALSGDERMIAAYQEGRDLHRQTAALITGTPLDAVTPEQRQAAKAVNFGLLFGMGAAGLAAYARNEYGVELSLERAEEFRARFFEAYTGVRRWHERARRTIAARGPIAIRTASGRLFRPKLPASLSVLLNTPVQGSAADIMKQAMIYVHHALAERQCDARIVAVVHDELIVESSEGDAGEALAIIRREMERAGAEFFAGVPFVADAAVVQHWAEKD